MDGQIPNYVVRKLLQSSIFHRPGVPFYTILGIDHKVASLCLNYKAFFGSVVASSYIVFITPELFVKFTNGKRFLC